MHPATARREMMVGVGIAGSSRGARRTVAVVAAAAAIGAGVGLWLVARDDGPGTEAVASGIDWSSPQPLPPPKRADFRSEFVSDARGYRFWPRSGRVRPSQAYGFDTGHCGLSFMPDFDGSFWTPIDPDGGEPPDFFYNQDVGAIALVGFDTAVYRSSNGREIELTRLPGPVVTQPCA